MQSTPQLTDWSAKRSGACQTVTGKVDGTERRIIGVYCVKRVQDGGRRHTVALDAAGIVKAYLAD